eukprot:TRINITY_DN1222_c1_g2_i2.p1 TRINITY_DN1222_c1_g2~~TRINITY_DN1222_c1_g2_i2.p1  ORF type:complete len:796 (+),score=117.61 TRINITY_DN1222_c1_g2_i2:326-2713(+)
MTERGKKTGDFTKKSTKDDQQERKKDEEKPQRRITECYKEHRDRQKFLFEYALLQRNIYGETPKLFSVYGIPKSCVDVKGEIVKRVIGKKHLEIASEDPAINMAMQKLARKTESLQSIQQDFNDLQATLTEKQKRIDAMKEDLVKKSNVYVDKLVNESNLKVLKRINDLISADRQKWASNTELADLILISAAQAPRKNIHDVCPNTISWKVCRIIGALLLESGTKRWTEFILNLMTAYERKHRQVHKSLYLASEDENSVLGSIGFASDLRIHISQLYSEQETHVEELIKYFLGLLVTSNRYDTASENDRRAILVQLVNIPALLPYADQLIKHIHDRLSFTSKEFTSFLELTPALCAQTPRYQMFSCLAKYLFEDLEKKRTLVINPTMVSKLFPLFLDEPMVLEKLISTGSTNVFVTLNSLIPYCGDKKRKKQYFAIVEKLLNGISYKELMGTDKMQHFSLLIVTVLKSEIEGKDKLLKFLLDFLDKNASIVDSPQFVSNLMELAIQEDDSPVRDTLVELSSKLLLTSKKPVVRGQIAGSTFCNLLGGGILLVGEESRFVETVLALQWVDSSSLLSSAINFIIKNPKFASQNNFVKSFATLLDPRIVANQLGTPHLSCLIRFAFLEESLREKYLNYALDLIKKKAVTFEPLLFLSTTWGVLLKLRFPRNVFPLVSSWWSEMLRTVRKAIEALPSTPVSQKINLGCKCNCCKQAELYAASKSTDESPCITFSSCPHSTSIHLKGKLAGQNWLKIRDISASRSMFSLSVPGVHLSKVDVMQKRKDEALQQLKYPQSRQ